MAATGLTAVLVACGGGGGVSTGAGPVAPVLPPATPSLVLSMVDGNGAATNAVSAAGQVFAKALLKDASGALVVGTKVVFSADAKLITLSPAAEVLTDASGVATVQLSAVSLGAAGAGTLDAAAVVATVAVNASKDFQVAPVNLSLTAFDVGSGALAAYDNRTVSVQANINGVPASQTPVQVTFSASCGTVNPVLATTDASGKAFTTYTADSARCAASNVRISASTVGVAVSQQAWIAVAAIQATNLQFVKAVPELIYLKGSDAATQALLTFRVVDATGNAVQNQRVTLSLLNPSAAAGLGLDVLGSTAAVSKTSDANGQVSVAVFSGNVPTSVRVQAALQEPSNVRTSSNILTVASGKAVQKAASLALKEFSIEGLDIDGTQTSVTLSLADRQANPVPDGTEVNFVAESGVMLPARCVVAGGTSQCTSTFRSSGTRPVDGRVSILAYVVGEEDFVDTNFNNQYDQAEAFTDMGNAYRDDDESGGFTAGEFSVPRVGGKNCVVGADGRAGTCDGVWAANEVRRQHILVLATSEANIAVKASSTGKITFTVSDKNDNFDRRFGRNSMPTGTTFAAEKIAGNDECSVKKVSPAILTNRYGPQDVVVNLEKCTPGALIALNVTSPLKITTSSTAAVP